MLAASHGGKVLDYDYAGLMHGYNNMGYQLHRDILDIDYINKLPQPFIATLKGGAWEWPVYDICVQTGLVRLDVCGKLDRLHISDVRTIVDADGIVKHVEYVPEIKTEPDYEKALNAVKELV